MPSVQSGDVRLVYEVAGSGPPVVLIGGFSADRAFWAGVVPLLADHRTVVTFDNRGVGASDAPDTAYDVTDMAADTLAVVDAVGVDGPVDVVGHSMGGAIALALAGHDAQRVGRIVLMQSFARFSGVGLRALTAAGRAYDQDPAPVRDLAEQLFPWLFSGAFLDDAYDDLVALSLANPTPQPRVGYERQLAALARFDATGWLDRIRAPALVVGAGADVLVPPEQAALLATVPRARSVTVPGVGHCMPVEDPDLTAALVRGFCG